MFIKRLGQLELDRLELDQLELVLALLEFLLLCLFQLDRVRPKIESQ